MSHLHQQESCDEGSAISNSLKACDIMYAARLCGLTQTQAHTLVYMCNYKQANRKTVIRSKSKCHSRVNNPERADSSRTSEYNKMIEGLADGQKLKRVCDLGHLDSKIQKGDHYQSSDVRNHTKRSIHSSSDDENDDDDSRSESTSSNIPTESPSPKRTGSVKLLSTPLKRSAKEKLDATLKRIKYLEEKQKLQVILNLCFLSVEMSSVSNILISPF